MGWHKKRPVTLTAAVSRRAGQGDHDGVHPASMIRRARVLLALDTSVGEVDPKEVIAARVGVSGETLRLVAKRFAETGGDVEGHDRAASSARSAGSLAGDRGGRGQVHRPGLLDLRRSATHGGVCGCWRSTSR